MPRKKTQANKSQLARATGLDRATVTKRLSAARVKPKSKKRGAGGGEIYDADEALRALTSPAHSALSDAKLKSVNVKAALDLLKYKKAKGELVDWSAALDEETRIFKWVIKELTFRRRREIVSATRKPRTLKEAEQVFTQNVMEVFSDLRESYRDRGVPDE